MKKKTKKLLLSLALLTASATINAQCTTTNITGNFIQNTDIILSGTYNVSGLFYVPPGVTVYVSGYSFGGCGKLEVNAQTIIIEGTINGDFSGYTGGNAGLGATAITSITGDAIAITNCNNKDFTGQVSLEGGKAGQNGNGAGAGSSGTNGSGGSGPKQQCLSNNDEAGMIGSSGGGGAGGGGSYGGTGIAGGSGGDGTNNYTATGVNVSTGFVIVGGTGGTGGASGNVYGTATGADIDLGSSGAGSGGGGLSFDLGLQGNKGGSGGGLVKFVAVDSLAVTGTITVNGENGKTGGAAGNGGQSPNCCSDGCDDAGEATLSCGAGGGGGSGAGSGGGIYLETQNAAFINGTLNSKGGNVGNGGTAGTGVTINYSGGIFCGTQTITSGNGSAGNTGGAGGGGRIKIFINNCSSFVNPVTNVNGGATALPGTYNVICTTLGIENNSVEKYSLLVYPVPATEELNVQFKNSVYPDEVGNIEVADLSGRIIFSAPCKLNKQSAQTISLSDFAAGIYFIKIQADNITVQQKFIKQ
ncbi:MAG: T9SS type A sorting domain-containing protein [Bacteroidia bacterium]|nr:T9SS type A sorting domain-containing protein [Bacteroidia bacterium]